MLLSGGMDSATCAYVARQEGYDVHALSFDYGQRMAKELGAARAVASAARLAEHVVMPIGLGAWGGCAITDPRIPLPTGLDVANPPTGVPATYTPARNMIFLSCALSYAEAIGAEAIYVGLIGDYPSYPDARPEFLVAFEEAARLGTRSGVDGRPIRVETPLLFMTKAQIVALGAGLGVPFELTWSCYRGEERPCGACDACRLRASGFATARMADPALSA